VHGTIALIDSHLVSELQKENVSYYRELLAIFRYLTPRLPSAYNRTHADIAFLLQRCLRRCAEYMAETW
jgi:hypothetical protein